MKNFVRTLTTLAFAASIWACSSDEPPEPECRAATDCPAGSICRDEACFQVCETTLDCTRDRCLDGICRAPTADDLPVITAILGNSASTGAIADGLVIEGLRLADATFELSTGAPTAIPLIARTIEATRAEVLLPATIMSGAYDLVVVNAAGTAQAPVTLTLPELGGDTLIDRINSEGTKPFVVARLPVGTASGTVAAGDHDHSVDYYPRSEADLLFYSQVDADALFYSRTEVDAGFYSRAETDGGFYSKSEIDSGYYTKTDADTTFYSQTQVHAGFYSRGEADSTFVSQADFPAADVLYVDAGQGRLGINAPTPAASLDVQGDLALNGYVTRTFYHVGDSSDGADYDVVLLDASSATAGGMRGAVTYVCGNRGTAVMDAGTAYFHGARDGDGVTLNGGVAGDISATLGPRWNGENLEFTIPRFYNCSGWVTHR